MISLCINIILLSVFSFIVVFNVCKVCGKGRWNFRKNCRADRKVSINVTGHKILYICYEDISGYNG